MSMTRSEFCGPPASPHNQSHNCSIHAASHDDVLLHDLASWKKPGHYSIKLPYYSYMSHVKEIFVTVYSHCLSLIIDHLWVVLPVFEWVE